MEDNFCHDCDNTNENSGVTYQYNKSNIPTKKKPIKKKKMYLGLAVMQK